HPAALAILNPVREEEEYPFQGLSGSGVAYKLACALRESLLGMSSPEEEGLDLAALGTVSDVVPLVDENRTLVSRALAGLKEKRRMGIQALLEVSSTDPNSMDASTIGFRIGPRINALGRLSDPRAAVELLVTRDESRAFEIATEMNRLNGKRQTLERQVTRDAHALIAQDGLFREEVPLLVVAGENWHRGVIGIVAARLVESYGRPVILLSKEDGILNGSGRSLPTMNLGAVLEAARPLLLSGGGHESAVGLSVEESRYEEVRDTLIARARELWGEHPEAPPLWLDGEIPLEQVDEHFLEETSMLAPFGEGNPRPVFLFRGDASLFGGRIVGNNHLRLVLSHPRGQIDAIGYGLGDRLTQLRLDRLQIAASPTLNSYRDRRTVQLRIVDIRSEENKPEPPVPPRKDSTLTPRLDRERLGTLFRLIRSSAENNILSRAVLYRESSEAGILKEEAYLGLIIFAELDLLRTRGDRIELLQNPEKRDLSQSPTFLRLTEKEQ
ncbi:MAG: DHHA1 domain-containing protein, partial [bacterium]